MSSGFISESEIAERKKCRQDEWEKVRKPDQPLEAPEEEYDHRSLFDRLQEQKQKRDFEYEEAHRLKHMIKGLDDDEVEFLELVDRSKLAEERKKRGEEEREMADFREQVASLQERSLDKRIQLELTNSANAKTNANSNSYTSQTKLLAGAVVKKRPPVEDGSSAKISPPAKKAKTADESSSTSSSPVSSSATSKTTTETAAAAEVVSSAIDEAAAVVPSATATGLRCIGILPGISYSESSDSATSDSDSDDNCCDASCQSHATTAVDMIGRKLFFKQKLASESE